MLERRVDVLPELFAALGHCLAMPGIGFAVAVALGGPLGVLLFLSGDGRPPGRTVDAIRSVPFIILLVVLVPLTRQAAGGSIVPLTIAAVPLFARLVEQALRAVPRGVIEAARAMGASDLQVVTRVLFVEARAGLVLALAIVAIIFLSPGT